MIMVYHKSNGKFGHFGIGMNTTLPKSFAQPPGSQI